MSLRRDFTIPSTQIHRSLDLIGVAPAEGFGLLIGQVHIEEMLFVFVDFALKT